MLNTTDGYVDLANSTQSIDDGNDNFVINLKICFYQSQEVCYYVPP